MMEEEEEELTWNEAELLSTETDNAFENERKYLIGHLAQVNLQQISSISSY